MRCRMQSVVYNALHETIYQCAPDSQLNLITYPMSARSLGMHEFWPTRSKEMKGAASLGGFFPTCGPGMCDRDPE